MNRIIVIFICLLLSLSLMAQSTGIITGKVAELENNEHIPFANISVLNSATEQVVKGGMSNENGTFQISQLPPGLYTLKVSYLGFEAFERDSIKIESGEITQIETIFLKKKLTELAEIRITAERPMIEQGLGKTTLNVNESMAGTGESALDLIQYIPSATTDEENNVILRGAPATVLIDGVETDMEKVLESLPVEAIDKMEIITNPSAKYSSQNGAGIINIVLKKNKLKGANGRANIALGTPENIRAGANLMLKVKKWSSYSNINLSRYSDQINSFSNRTTESETDTNFLHNDGNTDRTVNKVVARQGFKYQINRKSSIHISGAYNFNENSYNTFNESKKYNSDSSLRNHNQNRTGGTLNRHYWNVSTRYIKQFSSISELRVVAKYENQDNNHPYERTINFFDNATGEQKNNYTTQDRDYPELITSTRVQADFEHGINKHLKLDIGTLLLQRTSDASNDFLKKTYNFNETDSIYEIEIDSSQNYEFEINEWMPSVYALLTTEIGKWNMSGGVRYEYAHINAYSQTNDSLNFNVHHNILPTLQVSNRVNNKLTIGITASQRTKMPKYKQLNPFVSYHGLYFKSGGNPNLKPEKIWNFEFNAQTMFKKHTLSSSLYYRHFSDMISRHQHIIYEDGNEVLYRQFQNLGNVSQLGLEVNGNSRVTESIRIKFNANFMGQHIINSYKGEQVNIKDFAYNGKATINHSFFKDYQYQLTAVYNSPVQSVNGTKHEFYFFNFKVKKSILDKKGSINLLVTDVLNSMERRQLNTTSPNFTVDVYSKGITRKILLSFSYRFNTMKKK